MALDPNIVETSLYGTWIAMGIALAFQLYMLWLNWKQSKVKDKAEETNELLRVANTHLGTLNDKLDEVLKNEK